jgi:hypothetical protein
VGQVVFFSSPLGGWVGTKKREKEYGTKKSYDIHKESTEKYHISKAAYHTPWELEI